MSLIDNMKSLGLIAQVSLEEELSEHLETGSRSVYCGFDPTADSLHVGNLVPLLALRRFQLAGHRPILLVGGATGMIGDPGGRDAERELQSSEQVQQAAMHIRDQACQFLDFDCGDISALLVNNMDWTQDLKVIDYLRDIGKHFSVNAMLQKESVRRRIEDPEQGISYTEFSYMLLQSYDYAVLNEQYGCTIQVGGSDQWGNITAGMDLIRRISGNQAYAMTYPLVTRADGAKFGKSAGGAIWLDPVQTSPYAFYQFWLNTADADVMKFIRLFTFLPASEIQALDTSFADDPGKRQAQRELARQMTELVHGQDGLSAATRITQALFSGQLAELVEADLAQLAQDGMDATRMPAGSLLDALVETGMALTPKGEVTAGQARKLIQGNGISVNGGKVTDIDMQLNQANALFGKYQVLKKGKKHHHLVILEGAEGA